MFSRDFSPNIRSWQEWNNGSKFKCWPISLNHKISKFFVCKFDFFDYFFHQIYFKIKTHELDNHFNRE